MKSGSKAIKELRNVDKEIYFVLLETVWLKICHIFSHLYHIRRLFVYDRNLRVMSHTITVILITFVKCFIFITVFTFEGRQMVPNVKTVTNVKICYYKCKMAKCFP